MNIIMVLFSIGEITNKKRAKSGDKLAQVEARKSAAQRIFSELQRNTECTSSAVSLVSQCNLTTTLESASPQSHTATLNSASPQSHTTTFESNTPATHLLHNGAASQANFHPSMSHSSSSHPPSTFPMESQLMAELPDHFPLSS